ncbi:MAG: hypothetical protein IPN34_19835 [Planctomycetes bacterium]|nr:hypothetical protein [Planctomycetota bacterium]
MFQLFRVAFALALLTSMASAQANAYVVRNESGQRFLLGLDVSIGSTTRIGTVAQAAEVRGLAWGGLQPELWSISSGGNLGTLSTSNAAFTLRTTLPQAYYEELAWSPVLGEFWITRWNQNNGTRAILAYRPQTGALRTVGTLPFTYAATEICFDGAGHLWCLINGSALFEIDRTTLAARFISLLNRGAFFFEIDQGNGAFYALSTGTPEQILRIDPATGGTSGMAWYGPHGTDAWAVVPRVCLGRFLASGTSCPGTGGIHPVLDGYGCFGSGGTVHLSLRQAMSGATGILLFGLGPASLPLGNGCSLNIGPVFADPILALPLFGTGGAGQGFTTVNFVVPPGTIVASLALQALVFDVGAPGGFSATNGLRIAVE